MKLGFFTMPIHPLDKDWRQCLREDREAFMLADELGFVEGYVGEHVTDQAENITSCAMFIATLVDAPSASSSAPAPSTCRTRIRRRSPRKSPCSITCWMAASSSASARAACSRMPRCSAISTPTATRCSSRRSIRCCRSGPREPPYNIEGKYWKISTARTLMPEIGQGLMPKPLQRPHPPIVVTAVAPLLEGRDRSRGARLGSDLGELPDAGLGQEPLAEIRRGLREGGPPGRSRQLARRQEHLRRRRRQDREGLRHGAQQPLSPVLRLARHQAEEERPHRTVQAVARHARRRRHDGLHHATSSSSRARPKRSPTNFSNSARRSATSAHCSMPARTGSTATSAGAR